MKIIFDSEEQKEKFTALLINAGCPGYLRLHENCDICPTCEGCWEQAIEMEVKENKNE